MAQKVIFTHIVGIVATILKIISGQKSTLHHIKVIVNRSWYREIKALKK